MTATTSTADRLTELAGSEWDQNLLAHFHDHLEGEMELLETYAGVRDGAPEYVRYLIDLIMADEGRHHQMFRELVNRVRSDIDWREYGPRVPYITRKRQDAKGMIGATEALLSFEREDQKALQRLRKELRPVRDTTLFSLLVELMELDTKKHIAILEFIRDRASER